MSFETWENWIIAYVILGTAFGLLLGYIFWGARQLGGDDRINKRIFKG